MRHTIQRAGGRRVLLRPPPLRCVRPRAERQPSGSRRDPPRVRQGSARPVRRGPIRDGSPDQADLPGSAVDPRAVPRRRRGDADAVRLRGQLPPRGATALGRAGGRNASVRRPEVSSRGRSLAIAWCPRSYEIDRRPKTLLFLDPVVRFRTAKPSRRPGWRMWLSTADDFEPAARRTSRAGDPQPGRANLDRSSRSSYGSHDVQNCAGG